MNKVTQIALLIRNELNEREIVELVKRLLAYVIMFPNYEEYLKEIFQGYNFRKIKAVINEEE